MLLLALLMQILSCKCVGCASVINIIMWCLSAWTWFAIKEVDADADADADGEEVHVLRGIID